MLLLLIVVSNTALDLGQIIEATTVPEMLDNVVPVVSALENATHIQLYRGECDGH